MVLVGLFHGLVFLPVILSWIGPPPYAKSIISSRVGTPDQDADKHAPQHVELTTTEKPKIPSSDFVANGHSVNEHASNGVVAANATQDGTAVDRVSVEEGNDNPSF